MNYLEMKKKALHLIVGKVKGFVRSVTGTPPISLEACADNMSIINYKIHGNSFQDGEPSPDNPIEVQSVGELVTDESDVNYGKYKISVTARSESTEPITTNIYLDEPLRKVGDYADYIDFKNSMVVRNIGTYIITGNENLLGNYVDGSGTRSYILLANKKIGDSNSEVNILSDKLLGVGFKTASSTINNVHTYSGDTRIGFRIAHSLTDITTDDTVETVKSKLSTWFKNNKVVTYYHLQNSTQTSISLPILPTFKGLTTIYEVGTTIQPSNMEAEYYSTLKGE